MNKHPYEFDREEEELVLTEETSKETASLAKGSLVSAPECLDDTSEEGTEPEHSMPMLDQSDSYELWRMNEGSERQEQQDELFEDESLELYYCSWREKLIVPIRDLIGPNVLRVKALTSDLCPGEGHLGSP